MLWRDRYMRRLTYRMAILGALRNGREVSARGIASATGLRPQQVYPQLDYLQEKGWVEWRLPNLDVDERPLYRLVES